MQKLRERKVLFEQLAYGIRILPQMLHCMLIPGLIFSKTQVTPEQAKFLLSSSKVGRVRTSPQSFSAFFEVILTYYELN